MPFLLNGKTGREERAERKATKLAERRAVYAIVDRRDEGQCRACGRRCSTTATSSDQRGEHHHIIPRSLGGQETPQNVALVCVWCHDERHKKGTLRISGDAHERDLLGRLCGLTIERLKEHGWEIEGIG
jgi:hypothetical protein